MKKIKVCSGNYQCVPVFWCVPVFLRTHFYQGKQIIVTDRQSQYDRAANNLPL